MRRILIVVVAVVAILVVGAAATVLSLRQDGERKRNAQAATTEQAPVGVPTPTIRTAGAIVEAAGPATIVVTHTVRSGDTLLGIALEYDVPLEDVIAANDLPDPDSLDLGQEVIVPGVLPPTAVPQVPANLTGGRAVETLPKPANVTVNGLAEASFVLLSPAARQNAVTIYERGQALGRNPRAFSVVGDSTTEIPFFLGRFDGGTYNLGEYEYLQSVIDFFAGSFARDSVSVRVGLHSWTLFDPAWADKSVCQPNEAVLACEVRLNNPSIVLIRLGSNDAGVPELFDENIRLAVEYAIDNGIIPIIGTKADRHEGSNQNNDILRQIAADYQLPLWEYDLVAGTMAGRGLDVDGVHMTTFFQHDYTLPEAYERGHSLHNLTALMVLDTIWKEVILAN